MLYATAKYEVTAVEKKWDDWMVPMINGGRKRQTECGYIHTLRPQFGSATSFSPNVLNASDEFKIVFCEPLMVGTLIKLEMSGEEKL